jgi:hypothetical protein
MKDFEAPEKDSSPPENMKLFKTVVFLNLFLGNYFGVSVFGFTDPVESGSNPDLDPNLHHWKQKMFLFV